MGLIKRISIILFAIITLLFLVFRLVEVLGRDDEAPAITVVGETLEVSVEDSEEKLLKGITATDNKDGDVTDSIVVEKISKFVNGKRTVTYAVCDTSNNYGRATREITYKDYTPPRFTLKEPLIFYDSYDLDWSSKVGAYDVIDGDISRNVKIDISYDKDKYDIEFSVTNSAGDTSHLKAGTRVYEDKSNVAEILLENYLVYTKVGEDIEASSYLVEAKLGNISYSIDNGGDSRTIPKRDISIENNVDINKPGVYTITYSLSLNGYSGSTDLIVVVEE